jgi:hypothetical protein
MRTQNTPASAVAILPHDVPETRTASVGWRGLKKRVYSYPANKGQSLPPPALDSKSRSDHIEDALVDK